MVGRVLGGLERKREGSGVSQQPSCKLPLPRHADHSPARHMVPCVTVERKKEGRKERKKERKKLLRAHDRLRQCFSNWVPRRGSEGRKCMT